MKKFRLIENRKQIILHRDQRIKNHSVVIDSITMLHHKKINKASFQTRRRQRDDEKLPLVASPLFRICLLSFVRCKIITIVFFRTHTIFNLGHYHFLLLSLLITKCKALATIFGILFSLFRMHQTSIQDSATASSC